jgi:succinoglycan biosynthesis protein ExoA
MDSGTTLASAALSATTPALEVTVIIPCRNEARFIGTCLESVVSNDYPEERLEVLVVDGMSTDRTRAIVQEFAARCLCIRLIDNPKGITPAGLNIGIREARGDVIVRVDAHARVSRDYISRCVVALREHAVENVGGIMITLPGSERLIAKAIAAATSHRFGVGNSYFRTHTRTPRYVDTVFGGCYRRETLRRIGAFNERLPRTQDFEYNVRLRKAGGRILLLPEVVSYYHARPDLCSFCRHNFQNGVWAVLPFEHSEVVPISWRHLVPLAFVTVVLTGVLLAAWSELARSLLASLFLLYVSASLLASVNVATREHDLRLVLLMPWTFLLLHLGYGLGSLTGVLKLAFERLLG